MIKCAPEVMPAVELIMMVGIQAMNRAMLAWKIEETRELLQGNRREITTPVDEPVLNKGQSEEGSYNRIADQVEQPMVRTNHQEGGIDRSK